MGPPAGLCRTAAPEQRDLHQRAQHGGHQQRDPDRDHHQSGRPDADRAPARAAAGRVITGSRASRAGACGTRTGAAAIGGAESRAAEPDAAGARRTRGCGAPGGNASAARGNASAAPARTAAARNARTAAAAGDGDCHCAGNRTERDSANRDRAGRARIASGRQREARRAARVRNRAGNEAGDTVATAGVDDCDADTARNRGEACHADFADTGCNGCGADNTLDRDRTHGAACGSAQACAAAAACAGCKARARSTAAERRRAAIGCQAADTAAARWRGAATSAYAAGCH